MATATTSVKKAFDTQDDLKSRREHCAVAARTLASLDRVRGQQVRVHHDAEFALYTVSELLHETTTSDVRMGLPGRQRIGPAGEFAGILDTKVADPDLCDEDARTAGELVERLDDDGTQTHLIAIAPTAAASSRTPTSRPSGCADRLGSQLASSWRCKGWGRERRRLRPAGTSPPPTSTRPASRSSPRWRRGASPRRRVPRLRRRSGGADRRDRARRSEGAGPKGHRKCAPRRSRRPGRPSLTSATPATTRTTSSTGSAPCGGIQIEQGRRPATITVSPSPTPWPTCSARVRRVTSSGSRTCWRSCG